MSTVGSSARIFSTAFHYLQELFTNELTKHIFPKTFHKHFSMLEDQDLIFNKQVCFCGFSPLVDSRIINCLAMKLTIQSNTSPNVVHLSDFIRIEKRGNLAFVSGDRVVDVATLPGDALLSAEDAFLLFSNINTMKFVISSNKTYFFPFNGSLTRQRINKRYSHYNEPQLIQKYLGKLYCVDYIEFLIQQLSSQQLTLERLLRLNGAELLAQLADLPIVYDFIVSCITKLQNDFTQLTRSHKILYFLLLTLCQYYHSDRLPLVNQFFETNDSLITQIKQEFRVPTSLSKYETVSWNQVKAKYLI